MTVSTAHLDDVVDLNDYAGLDPYKCRTLRGLKA